MKKSLNFFTCIAMILVATAQASMGTACLLFLHQPRVPKSLTKND